jgi:CoA:oxalate CoA-transferase
VSDRPNLPLAGIIVLDFGQVFQGPYATLLMAKAGANVIKIEPPHGEPLRRRAPPGKSTTFPIAMLNSKRAITLNPKHERGRALLFEMARRADVLLENFSPGTMNRLGVGWAELCPVNPRLVYASGSGYGLSGPDRDNLAMDLTIQAVSSPISTTGFADSPPVKAGPAIVEFPLRHPPLRRGDHGAVRARAHGKGPAGRSRDARSRLRHADLAY